MITQCFLKQIKWDDLIARLARDSKMFNEQRIRSDELLKKLGSLSYFGNTILPEEKLKRYTYIMHSYLCSKIDVRTTNLSNFV